jgi:hypothetical protein
MRKHDNIIEWGRKINWDKRVKAICKPCWELKYCPYGPLVEESPIKAERELVIILQTTPGQYTLHSKLLLLYRIFWLVVDSTPFHL